MTDSRSPEELLAMSRRLMAEVQALSTRISAVNEIAVAMNRTLDLTQILKILGQQAKWMLDFDHCSVYLPAETDQSLHVLFGDHEQVLGFLASIPTQPLQRALDTHQPQLLKEVEHGPFRSIMIMPLQTENHVHGTLNFAAKRPEAYSFDDLRIAYILALLLAAALRNALQFKQISRLYGELQTEQERSQQLLLNVLPEHVAEELKQKGYIKPTLYPAATVLFTDFVNFSHTTTSLEPQALVDLLDQYFSLYDQICARWGIEKLKTIGDSYMAVGGVPVASSTHALQAVCAALEIRDHSAALFKHHGRGWQVRIGLHSGPVIAGVVGHQKFAYDIWGTTVNIAARLETASEPGQINISQATYELVKDYVLAHYRGNFNVKQLVDLPMYFVQQFKPEFNPSLFKQPQV